MLFSPSIAYAALISFLNRKLHLVVWLRGSFKSLPVNGDIGFVQYSLSPLRCIGSDFSGVKWEPVALAQSSMRCFPWILLFSSAKSVLSRTLGFDILISEPLHL
jgi:hypothetical protein